jgi:hypothetical protein
MPRKAPKRRALPMPNPRQPRAHESASSRPASLMLVPDLPPAVAS